MCVPSDKQNRVVCPAPMSIMSSHPNFPTQVTLLFIRLQSRCTPQLATATAALAPHKRWGVGRLCIDAATHIVLCSADVCGSPDCVINAQRHPNVELPQHGDIHMVTYICHFGVDIVLVVSHKHMYTLLS